MAEAVTLQTDRDAQKKYWPATVHMVFSSKKKKNKIKTKYAAVFNKLY